MSAWKIITIIAILALFIFAKGWVMTHPKSMFAVIFGAALLIFSEPACAK